MEESHSKKNNLSIIALAIFILFSLSLVIFLYYQNQQLKDELSKYRFVTPVPQATPMIIEKTASPSASPIHIKKTPTPKPVACTTEAKICPDGTAVGRTGPNCEFAPCPTP